MDADALSNLPRSELISLAKANKIKANLATIEIIRQLMQRFPDGVPPATPKAPSSPAASAKALVGRVKDALKSIKRSSRTASPSLPASNPPSQDPAAVDANPILLKVPEPATLESPARTLSQEPVTVEAPVKLKVLESSVATLNESLATASTLLVAHENAATSGESSEPTDAVAETTTLPPVDIPPADAAEKTEEDADDSSAANPEDVRLLIQDMARVSAKNKNYLEKAAAMRARVQKINDETTALRMALMVEQVRRQRMETYFKHWRPIAPKWSYSEVWDGPITLAPVFVRFENAKGSIVMDKEVSTSDDEELVSEWHLQHEQFLARRKASAEKKAEERGVDVEMVSDEEMASDEEDFYSPFVLRPKDVDGTMPDSKCHVYPLFDRLARGVSVYLDEDIVVPSCSKRRLADNAQSDDEARYSPRARIDEALDEKEDAALEKKEDDAEDWEKNIAIKMGEAVDSKWEGLGVMQDGWRMRVNL